MARATNAHVTVHLSDFPDDTTRTAILTGTADPFASVTLGQSVVLIATESADLLALASTLTDAAMRLTEAQHERQINARALPLDDPDHGGDQYGDPAGDVHQQAAREREAFVDAEARTWDDVDADPGTAPLYGHGQ